MMFTRIWERYFLKETAKVFFLFLMAFYALYALLDYSSHSATFHRDHVRFDIIQVARYYTFEFIARLDVLIPFALLIACIKTLCSLNVNRELVALLAGGIKFRSILRPFVLMGLFCTAFVYLNTEVLFPYASKELRQIQDKRSVQKIKKHYKPPVERLSMDDGSTFIFHHLDTTNQTFYDLYWVLSIDEIYHMKSLSFNSEGLPEGSFVDHMKRDQEGNLIVEESYQQRTFPHLQFNLESLKASAIPDEELSLSELRKKFTDKSGELSEKEASTLTAFYYKLTLPWLCLLVVVGPAPFCIRFTRSLPVFMIYACSIFGLVAFYIIMNAAMILGERQVMPPILAIGLPFSCFSAWLCGRFFLLK